MFDWNYAANPSYVKAIESYASIAWGMYYRGESVQLLVSKNKTLNFPWFCLILAFFKYTKRILLVDCSGTYGISLFPTAEGSSKMRRWADCKNQRTRSKQDLLDMSRLLHSQTLSICGCLHVTCTRSNLSTF